MDPDADVVDERFAIRAECLQLGRRALGDAGAEEVPARTALQRDQAELALDERAAEVVLRRDDSGDGGTCESEEHAPGDLPAVAAAAFHCEHRALLAERRAGERSRLGRRRTEPPSETDLAVGPARRPERKPLVLRSARDDERCATGARRPLCALGGIGCHAD